MPRIVGKKEEGVPLEELKKEATQEKIKSQIMRFYDAAINEFTRLLSAEARKGQQTKNDPDSLRRLADTMEKTKHLEINLTGMRYTPKNVPKEYQERIGGFLGRAEQSTPSEILREAADITEESEGKIRFFPTIRVTPSEALIKELRKSKEEVADDLSTIIIAGLNGKTARPFGFTFDDEETAELFFNALKKAIGIENPTGEEKIAFDDAKIPKGKQPLEVKKTGRTVSIGWPSWLSVGKSSLNLAEAVPKKSKE